MSARERADTEVLPQSDRISSDASGLVEPAVQGQTRRDFLLESEVLHVIQTCFLDLVGILWGSSSHNFPAVLVKQGLALFWICKGELLTLCKC